MSDIDEKRKETNDKETSPIIEPIQNKDEQPRNESTTKSSINLTGKRSLSTSEVIACYTTDDENVSDSVVVSKDHSEKLSVGGNKKSLTPVSPEKNPFGNGMISDDDTGFSPLRKSSRPSTEKMDVDFVYNSSSSKVAVTAKPASSPKPSQVESSTPPRKKRKFGRFY